MYTLMLQIKTVARPETWYAPDGPECRAYPRTEGGIGKALKKFQAFCEVNAHLLLGARIVMYEGRYGCQQKGVKLLGVETIYEGGNST